MTAPKAGENHNARSSAKRRRQTQVCTWEGPTLGPRKRRRTTGDIAFKGCPTSQPHNGAGGGGALWATPRSNFPFDFLGSLRLRVLALQRLPPSRPVLYGTCTGHRTEGGLDVPLFRAPITLTQRPHALEADWVNREVWSRWIRQGGALSLKDAKRRRKICARGVQFKDVRRMLENKPPPVTMIHLGGGGHLLSEKSERSTGMKFQRAVAVGTHQALPRAISKMGRFVVRRSGIASLGVYTTEAIPKGELLMEYVGEIVRRSVADLRERKYALEGLDMGCYLFALGPEWVIDATAMGNMARYINHSCNPNCIAKLVTPVHRDARETAHLRRVFIYAKRDIVHGEELCYDYKLSALEEEGDGKEDGQLGLPGAKPILCTCGEGQCRGYL